MTPDPKWLPFLKMTFGLLLLIELGVLVAVIGLGNVEMKSSYGLGEIIGGLLTLAGAFGHWAFGVIKEDKDAE